MDRRRLALTIGALWAPSREVYAAAQAPQDGVVLSETLVSTPPLEGAGGGAVLMLSRITYGAKATLEVRNPGPVVLYVEAGALAVTVAPGRGLALLYSGPEPTPPQPEAQSDGTTALPAGYAVLADGGVTLPTRNAGTDPLIVYAVSLGSEAGAGDSAVFEATAEGP